MAKSPEIDRGNLSDQPQGEFGKDSRLAGQIQSTAISVVSKIADGFERGGLGEFHQFLSTAKTSCAELRSQLYLALDVGYIDAPQFEQLRVDSEEACRIIVGLRVSRAMQRQNKPR